MHKVQLCWYFISHFIFFFHNLGAYWLWSNLNRTHKTELVTRGMDATVHDLKVFLSRHLCVQKSHINRYIPSTCDRLLYVGEGLIYFWDSVPFLYLWQNMNNTVAIIKMGTKCIVRNIFAAVFVHLYCNTK